MLVFRSKNYRVFLKTWVENQDSPRGLLSKLSEAMSCHNSHLSRVLREEIHLTPDQAFGATQFMKFGKSERNYFLKLVEFERVSNPQFREMLSEELDEMRREQENLSKKFKDSTTTNSITEMTYYSAWFWSAVHVITNIPQYQDARSIAARLGLNEIFVRECLQKLAELGLVKLGGEKYKNTNQFVHLPKTSPMNSVQHMNWRNQAVRDSQNLQHSGIHYTIVQTVSEKDYENIKEFLLQTIGGYREIADKSKEEELVCFSCDFFKV